MEGYIQIPTIWLIVLSCTLGLLMCGAVFLFWRNRYRRIQLREELLRKTTDLEEQVEESRTAVKVKGDFLSMMSHEIRTPLNVIMGMMQIIRNTTDLSKINDCIEKMEYSSQHLLGIINDILDLSKIESGNLTFEETLFSLTREIEFVASMFREKATEKGLILDIKVGDIRHDGIVTDKLRLNQVLINLMSNATKFTDSGGTVELIVEELFHMEGESVYRFIVRDNGIGIEPAQANKLFTPFTQAHGSVTRVYGGTGLGLAISQNIVQMMGGDIELETEFEKGSTFQFTIRVSAKEKAEDPPKDKSTAIAPEGFKGKRILVVDDNVLNLSVASGLLRLYGIMTETAESGQQAIELIQQTQYDLVFMDHMMPGMDGIETTRAVRELGIDVTIIALTANALKGQKEMMLEAGMDDYLSKPIVKTELQQMLMKWIPTEKLFDSISETAPPDHPKEEMREEYWDKLEQIEGLDLSVGLERSDGQRDIYEKLLKLMLHEIEKSEKNLNEFLSAKDMSRFRIEVHGIKGALANIGAMGLSAKAYELELASDRKDVAFCAVSLPAFLEGLECLGYELEKAFPKINRGDELIIIPPELPSIFDRLIRAFSEIDFERIDMEADNLNALSLTGVLKEETEQIMDMVMVMDYDEATEHMRKLLGRELAAVPSVRA